MQRGKKAPEGLTPAEQISDFQQIASHPGLHSASIPGILALDLSADSSRAITGIVCNMHHEIFVCISVITVCISAITVYISAYVVCISAITVCVLLQFVFLQ